MPKRGLAVLSGLVVSALFGFSGARAETLSMNDEGNDVVRFDLDAKGTTAGSFGLPAEHRAQGDITGVKVNHPAREVRVRIGLRELSRTGTVVVTVLLKSPGLVRRIEIAAWQPVWHGFAAVVDRQGTEVRCDMSWEIDYARNSINIDVPRSCLGDPPWVRVGTQVLTLTDRSAYVDDGGRVGSTAPHRDPDLGKAVRH